MTAQAVRRKRNKLYAHWLDGEWLKIAHQIPVGRPFCTLNCIAEGALKLHALLGTRLVISDVQLTDSEVTTGLFANEKFRDYLKIDKNFLTLAASPRSDISDKRLAAAISGILRADNPEWRSSLPGMSVKVIRQFSDKLLSTGKTDTARWIKDRSTGPGRFIDDHPKHKGVLEGMLRGICHFTKKSGGPLEFPVRPQRSYADFIEDALNGKGMDCENFDALGDVWKLIRKWVPNESQRFRRTSLLEAMEKKESGDRSKWSCDSRKVWNTVVHAWNGSVCDTVGADGASIASLPDAVVAYRGKISDSAGPFRRKDQVLSERTFGRFPAFRYDPRKLTWSRVKEVVTEVGSERDEFQKQLRNGSVDDIKGASDRLITKLSGLLTPPFRPVLPDWAWLVHLAGILAGVPPEVLVGIEFGDKVVAVTRTRVHKASVFNTLNRLANEIASDFRRTNGK